MKFNYTILLFLGVTSARKLHHHHSHRFSGVPIGERLLQTNQHTNQWDSDVLKVMNADTYLDDVRDSMSDVQVNKEFNKRPNGKSDDESLDKKIHSPEFAQKDTKKKSLQQITEEQNNAQEANLTDSSGTVRRSSVMPFEEEEEITALSQEDKANLKTLNRKKQEKLMTMQILAQEKEQVLDGRLQAMNQVWHQFGETLDLDARSKAIQMHDDLVKEGLDLAQLRVQTKQIYENSFEFKQMAQNENVQTMLKDLDVAQGNFNENPSNPGMMNQFMITAQKTALDLKKAYPDFWHTPGAKASGWAAAKIDE